MGVFSGVEKAQSSQGGVYPEAGVYPVLNVSALKIIPSRKGDSLFCAELEILDSNVESRVNGTTMSWMANLSKHDAAIGNVKGFIAALMNINESEVDEATCEQMVDEAKQPGRNRLIRLEANMVKTKAGGDFTKCNWHGVPEAKQGEVQELREAAGF